MILQFILIGVTVAEFTQWPIYVSNGYYVSPPIGMGPNGGEIIAQIDLVNNRADDAYVAILSSAQLAGWKQILESSDMLEVHAMPSTVTRAVKNGSVSMRINVNIPLADQYSIVVVFTGDRPEDETDMHAGGILRVDWMQNDGTFLQYQFKKLPFALQVMFNVVTCVLAVYLSIIIVNMKLVTILHYIFLFLVSYTLLFLACWRSGLLLEDSVGDRSHWKTRWIPGLLEKGFDIIEVVVYFIVAVGWKSVRNHLYPTELQFITIGSTISFILGVFEIACGDDAVSAGNFTSARMIVHMFGYLAAIVGFNFQLAFGTSILQDSSIASRDTARTYFFLDKFWWFRAVFLAFIIQPTVSVVIRSDILDWQDDWLFVTFFWATKIALLVTVAFVFRPQPVSRMSVVEMSIKERRRQANSVGS
jgi:hypothetical protein